ncbi:hypothetical protein RRG08_061156 [Elysia crispata]|uniref:Uncharacterized protein n=1 Tax=Elysia crispata TaxID=231223 RepID=A0AAE1CEP1_9GAST|nr:hypothetical protein RRG08_061156 [Elysia crispata]
MSIFETTELLQIGVTGRVNSSFVSVAKGSQLVAKGDQLVAEGGQLVAKGRGQLVAKGSQLFAKGDQLVAKGDQLVAEGGQLVAEGGQLVAKGSQLFAKGDQLVAEGGQLVAKGGQLIVEVGKLVAEGGQLVAEGGQLVVKGGQLIVEGGQLVAKGGQLVVEGGQLVVEGVITLKHGLQLDHDLVIMQRAASHTLARAEVSVTSSPPALFIPRPTISILSMCLSFCAFLPPSVIIDIRSSISLLIYLKPFSLSLKSERFSKFTGRASTKLDERHHRNIEIDINGGGLTGE